MSREEASKAFAFVAKYFGRFDTDGDGRWSLAEVVNALNHKQKLVQEVLAQSTGKHE